MAAFMNVVPEHRRLEIGHIWYAPSAQRTEANTEAAYLMIREAFDELGNRRVEWKCDALNERSRAAALRLGFTFEGVFRKHMIVRGRNRDSAWFSLLDTEWPAAQDALERWLDAIRARRPPVAPRRCAEAGLPDSGVRGLVARAPLDAAADARALVLRDRARPTGPRSIAARRSSPVTGRPLLGRLSSSWPRYDERAVGVEQEEVGRARRRVRLRDLLGLVEQVREDVAGLASLLRQALGRVLRVLVGIVGADRHDRELGVGEVAPEPRELRRGRAARTGSGGR